MPFTDWPTDFVHSGTGRCSEVESFGSAEHMISSISAASLTVFASGPA
jgi:hypothetical protein